MGMAGPRQRGRRWRVSAGKQRSRRVLRGCLEGSFQVVAVTSLCWELTEQRPRMSGDPTEPSPRPWGAGALLVPISRRRKLRRSWSGSRANVHSWPQASTAALSRCPGQEPSGHAQVWKERGAYLTLQRSGLSDPRGREASLGMSGWSKRAQEDGPRRGAPWRMGWEKGTPFLGQHPHRPCRIQMISTGPWVVLMGKLRPRGGGSESHSRWQPGGQSACSVNLVVVSPI